MRKGIMNDGYVRAKRKIVDYSRLFHTMVAVGIMLSVALSSQAPSIAKDDKFFCETETNKQGKTVPLTIVRAKRGNEIRIIYWLSEYFTGSGITPVDRCKNTSQQFQKYYDNGWLKYIRTDFVDGSGVICVARIQGGKCLKTDVIVVLPPNINRFEALGNLMDLRRIASGKLLYLTDRLINYEKGEAYISLDIFLKDFQP